jgi:hypothetical protein
MCVCMSAIEPTQTCRNGLRMAGDTQEDPAVVLRSSNGFFLILFKMRFFNGNEKNGKFVKARAMPGTP